MCRAAAAPEACDAVQSMLDKAGRLLLTALQAGITASQLSAETAKDALRQVWCLT